ncbi:hypothetical protein [Sporanaerobacter acetigenes]|uniref:hypothetical protein n=1 Tax=Sporanaerobacter acetigenes TaxID=165813 RepID=UPI00104CE87A|nr:hypothetical protein [Sporanaerobacter acetigenes]
MDNTKMAKYDTKEFLKTYPDDTLFKKTALDILEEQPETGRLIFLLAGAYNYDILNERAKEREIYETYIEHYKGLAEKNHNSESSSFWNSIKLSIIIPVIAFYIVALILIKLF